MTLRGRLTTAFLVVVLGPVLLGSFFVGMTVATVSGERTTERLDHAVTSVRNAMGSLCGQLQAVADAIAVLPPDSRKAAADQMVNRGLATEVRIAPGAASGAAVVSGAEAGQGPDRGRPVDGVSQATERDCAGPSTAPAAQGDALTAAVPASPADADGGSTAVTAGAARDGFSVVAVARTDEAFMQRLADTSGAAVAQGRERGEETERAVATGPGQPMPLVVSVPGRVPYPLYGLLGAAVIVVAGIAIVVARWLARSTTRPLEDLVWAAGKVADGELGVRVPVRRDDEIGQLAGTFNRMTRELQAYVQALTASRDQLRGHLAILGDTLSSTHDLDRILQVLLQTALSASGARAGIVLLTDPVDGDLVGRYAEGLTGRWDVPGNELASLRVPRGRGILGAVAASGEPRRGFCGIGGGLVDEPPCRTYVAVPICAPASAGDPLVPGEWETSGQPAVLGVLALYDRLGSDEFDDADLLMLRTFAGQAGVAVHNVRMHEEAQRLSLTDPLTGLWNYRYLRESMRREVERASRFGRRLTVLVLDLDHFKEVNDTYGHAAGDTVLGEFARRVRVALREVDVAFRQGGEEFVVLLPETDAYGGIVVAERLGAALRDHPVLIDSHRAGAGSSVAGDRVRVTVSIGVAVFPEHGATVERVLAAADDALYAAKSAGRDTYRLAAGERERTMTGSQYNVQRKPDGWRQNEPRNELRDRSREEGQDCGLAAGGVTQAAVSPGVDEGQFDHPESVPGASGGPQPPRQGRGR
ncbi:diguanylate cyclase [Actinoplanes sp. NPDC051859]|uniref:diguanylate cyclase n=1 Tax=Actinoplanes sp. NPDC051859 TaxID=3363909 RepID=UPI0037A1FB30